MFNTIKADQLGARKARDSVRTALLTTLMGAIQADAKDKGLEIASDDICIAKIRSFLKSNDELAKAMILGGISTHDINREAMLLHSYLPQQMTDAELRHFVRAKIDNGCKSLGDLMKALKSERTGLYDGKMAGTIIKQELETFQTF
jgi:uncharacterized protein YqeY